jgi:hypothetical protein
MDPPSKPTTFGENIPSHEMYLVHQMRIKEAFEGLTDKEKLYAHWLARCD